MSKGSHRRPSSVPRDVYEQNWDRAFGNRPAHRARRRRAREESERFEDLAIDVRDGPGVEEAPGILGHA